MVLRNTQFVFVYFVYYSSAYLLHPVYARLSTDPSLLPLLSSSSRFWCNFRQRRPRIEHEPRTSADASVLPVAPKKATGGDTKTKVPVVPQVLPILIKLVADPRIIFL